MDMSIRKQLILHDTTRPEGIYGNYLTESSFGGPINECEKICLPMNWNKEHWYLCIIDIISRQVFICDSAPDSDAVNKERENNAKIVCAAIEEALSYGFGHGHKGDVNNYKFTMPENCPKQGNGSDCGIYIAKFMEHCGDVKSGFKLL
ncbi:ubiquitin-like-specific protease 1 [Coffea arabica]|uniref:Ubiquitin-like-specific protease 1 n=1 Tax=Coffea arabica TaxID=13443 RepID=A0ABM4UYH4_COFAR